MVKEAGWVHSTPSPQRGIRRSTHALLLSLPLLWWIAYAFDIQPFTLTRPTGSLESSSSAKTDEFKWSQITPTTHLSYTPCFGKFQCARLDVPMDYNATHSDGLRVTVAIIRLPAPVSVVDPRYGGIILMNPGGPGGSGVFFSLIAAERLATIVNPIWESGSLHPTGTYFDIVSFDPRGVNNTTPTVKCFPGSSSFDIWRYQEESDGLGSSDAISKLWARSQALATGCSQNDEIVQHMNTPPVVADMVEIIERHGEWRSKEAESWLATKDGQSAANSFQSMDSYYTRRDAIIERTRWRKGEEKLQYWGFSYGSVLGATFAALQPHRVGRVILDGIEDSTDYYTTAWALNLKDTDRIIDKFYDYCAAAGPEKCSLNSGTSDPADIRESFESLVSDIKENPFAVPATATRGPEIITYSDVMNLIRPSLYKPLDLFPRTAKYLADLKGNGSVFADIKQELHQPSCPLQECGGMAEPCYPGEGLATGMGILCSDGAPLSDISKAGFKKYAAALYEQSRWLGELWAAITVKCYHWKGKAAWRIKSDEIKGNTSHPILWIGNTLDPVTPLSNAHIMAAKFPGSVVLTQESEGHCSTSSPSLCTAKYVREYFQTGNLPEPGTVCQPQERPFIGNITEGLQELSTEDEVLLSAMRGIAKDTDFSGYLGSW